MSVAIAADPVTADPATASREAVTRTAPAVIGGVPPAGSTWLQSMNIYRSQSGLSPVVEEPAWTAGLSKHIVYLRNTDPSLKSGPYASAHTENPASPYYTADGAAGAAASNIGFGSNERDAIDVWMRAPFHAIGMLRAELTKSTFALDGTAMLDVLRGLGPPLSPRPTILFPGAGSTTYLGSFGSEVPDPREGCAADWKTFAGLPIFAMFPPNPSPEPPGAPAGTTATLTMPDGSIVTQGDNLCVQTASTFNSTDTVYGPNGKSILAGDNAVVVMPRAALVAGLYTVNVLRPGKPPTTWSFTELTVPTAPVQSSATWAGSGKVRVIWNPPLDSGGVPVTGYAVNGLPFAADARAAVVNVPPNQAKGSVTVSAINDIGVGKAAAPPWNRPLLPNLIGVGATVAVATEAGGGAQAVLANLTMADAAGPGYVTADLCSAIIDGPQSKSSANHGSGAAVANLAVVAVDSISTFCLYTQVPTNMIVDIQGSFSPTGVLAFTPVSPARVLDTRAGGAKPAAGSITRVPTGAPPGTQAVLVNLTMTGSPRAGYITADRCSALLPGQQTKSTGNHGVNDPVANLAVVPVDADGTFCIYTQQPSHLLVDIQGSFSPTGALKFTPKVPSRNLDTRSLGAIPPAGSIVRVATGLTSAQAVLVNIAMTDAVAAGYVTADRCSALAAGEQSRSSGNHGVGQAVSNLSVVPVDADGSFCIYTQQATQLVVDVQGSFSTSGALAFTPSAPTRVLDTRTP